MTRAQRFDDDDSAFLEAVWQNVDRTALGGQYPAVVGRIDRLFREDTGKDAHPDVQAYRDDLTKWLGRSAPRGRNSPPKPYDTAAEWLRGDRFDSREEYLWFRGEALLPRWRVYVNAVPGHAAEIFVALTRTITAEGLDADCKMGSYAIVKSGRDAIVCYAKTTHDRDVLLQTLTNYLADKTQYVRPGAVRFTVRCGSGIGFVADPPGPDSVEALAASWHGTPEGRLYLPSRGWVFNERSLQMSFSDMIVNLLASCMLSATTDRTFRQHAQRAIITDLGLNLATGELNPTVNVIGWLRHRLYTRTTD